MKVMKSKCGDTDVRFAHMTLSCEDREHLCRPLQEEREVRTPEKAVTVSVIRRKPGAY